MVREPTVIDLLYCLYPILRYLAEGQRVLSRQIYLYVAHIACHLLICNWPNAEPIVFNSIFDSRLGIRPDDRLRQIATVYSLTVQSGSAEGKKSAFVGTLVPPVPHKKF